MTARRDFVIANLLERYEQPEPHDWPCRDFSIHRLAENPYLLNCALDEPGRTTLRTTIWQSSGGSWKIAFHQGTIAG
ncbi:hypothetical protein GR247_28760 [Rhizobium leguminosarum]|uniref:hypothetical protein n=1 Tax=Rhizobium ruizarguesonis TaxID=2081791 RepID=UPI000370B79D|nr:hypothetical protein [Rhizobium ruizarguesonis]NEJ24118.1 hypothetical protein [Rhizobium leguminosarum]NKK59290.1 hypothetical protein [Rhizobium leguminosarum bv. viciae]TAY74991.1 hypothetical protein ELH84_14530 [Rhizobium ruizarguesonis]